MYDAEFHVTCTYMCNDKSMYYTAYFIMCFFSSGQMFVDHEPVHTAAQDGRLFLVETNALFVSVSDWPVL